MKKIYIVTSGEYSSYSVEAVFDSEALAKKFIDSVKTTTTDINEKIEAYELNIFKKQMRNAVR